MQNGLILNTNEEALSSGVTQHFVHLQVTRNKGGGTASDFGKTLYHTKAK